MLGTLLLAEISENKGRFIDPIINGVWSICEESFRGVPAHWRKTKELSGLMDVSKPFVELTDGFFVAAKGGNNGESHNHNDVGTRSAPR